MPAAEELRALARNGLSEIAVRGLASRGLFMDAVFYLLDGHAALLRQAAGGGPGDRLRDRDAGAARAGRERPQGDTCPAGSAPAGSALELLCIMYAGFKQFEPGMDIGVDLGEEWGMAEKVGGEETNLRGSTA